MGYVNDRDVAHLGPILAAARWTQLGDDPDAVAGDRGAAAARRVSCCTAPTTTSSRRSSRSLLAQSLRARGVTVHQLATPLITHAEVDRVGTASAIVAIWSRSGEKLLSE